VEVTSRQLFAGPGDEDEAARLDEARTFLRDYFTDAAKAAGVPVEDVELAAEDVEAAADKAGIADRTLDRQPEGEDREQPASLRRQCSICLASRLCPCRQTFRGRHRTWRLGELALTPQGRAAPDHGQGRRPMTTPVTPAHVEAELRRLARRFEAKCDELPDLLRAAVEADVNYRFAYAKALLAADGDTGGEHEARATLAVADELTPRRTTEAVADAAKESIRALRDQGHAVMSVNRNVRYAPGLEQ